MIRSGQKWCRILATVPLPCKNRKNDWEKDYEEQNFAGILCALEILIGAANNFDCKPFPKASSILTHFSRPISLLCGLSDNQFLCNTRVPGKIESKSNSSLCLLSRRLWGLPSQKLQLAPQGQLLLQLPDCAYDKKIAKMRYEIAVRKGQEPTWQTLCVPIWYFSINDEEKWSVRENNDKIINSLWNSVRVKVSQNLLS